MFFAKSFEIWSVRGITKIVVRRIVARIRERVVGVSFVSWEIADAVPVLDFWTRKRVRKDTDITRVLTEPRRMRNCSRFSFPIISEPIIAA